MEHPIDLVTRTEPDVHLVYLGRATLLLGDHDTQRKTEIDFRWQPHPRLWLTATAETTAEALRGFGEPITFVEALDPWPPSSPPEGGDDPGAGTSDGPVNGVMLGSDQAVTDVLVYILNLTSGLSLTARPFDLEFGPWLVHLAPSPLGQEVRDQLQQTGLYGVTHLCRITKADGSLFRWSDDETELLADCLWYSLSSLNGTMVGFALPAGFANDEVVWCEASVTGCDRARHALAWSDEHHFAQQARQLAPSIYEAFSDPFLRRVLRRVIRITIEANDASPLDTAVPTAQAGLELLAWAVLVEREQWLHHDARLDAAGRIRLLLRWAGIPTGIPDEFAELGAWCGARISEDLDGPRAITFVRRTLVHPPKKAADWPDHEVLHLAWRLALGYLELAMLRVLGYDGVYASRHYLEGRWVGTVEPVPWVAPDQTT